ncbi:lysophosphatidic acid receptor 6-like [Halichoeres trimaculatus]|uniref:lysophosphatidic acid receptor 6-like n=1 Tax=Halichoeres trimaculatus TaxID=147232 RepID=UPI003D9F29FE
MNNTLEGGPEPQLVYAVLFGCIMVLGLPLNALSLWILLRHHWMKCPNVVYMVNLAISDLLLAFSLPMRIYFYATGTWPIGDLACNLITMLFKNNIRSSSFFITLISVDRLLAVVYPLRSRHLRTWSNAWKAAGVVWLFVVVVSIPESMSFSTFLNSLNQSLCFEVPQRPKEAKNFIQPVLVFTMLAVNIVCTALVLWTLRKHLNDSARVKNKRELLPGSTVVLLFFGRFLEEKGGCGSPEGTSYHPLGNS